MEHQILKQKIGDMLELTYDFNLEMARDFSHESEEVKKGMEAVQLYGTEFVYHLMMVYVNLEQIDRNKHT